MELIIRIKCDNAAFEGDPGLEVARILREYADDVADGVALNRKLRDINGNTVGSANTR